MHTLHALAFIQLRTLILFEVPAIFRSLLCDYRLDMLVNDSGVYALLAAIIHLLDPSHGSPLCK